MSAHKDKKFSFFRKKEKEAPAPQETKPAEPAKQTSGNYESMDAVHKQALDNIMEISNTILAKINPEEFYDPSTEVDTSHL